MTINYRTANVSGIKIFYREAGSPSAPTLLLLHGFPSSSHMFRDLIPLLAERYHLVAPDFPGFGQSDMPERSKYQYTFANIADTITGFTEAIGLKKFAIYIFDYGSPVGLRMALKNPDRDLRHHLTKWKCLRGGFEQRLGSDSGLLEGGLPSQPRCLKGLS